jgi:hypothetical protein
MVMLAVPMTLLYLVSIQIARFVKPFDSVTPIVDYDDDEETGEDDDETDDEPEDHDVADDGSDESPDGTAEDHDERPTERDL